MAPRALRKRRMQIARLRGGLQRRRDRRTTLKSLPKGAVCAEVGTWKGDNAAAILRSTRPSLLYLIDPWRHQEGPDFAKAMYGGLSGGQIEMDGVHDAVLRRFRRQIKRAKVVVKRQASVDAAQSLPEGSLDWAYIDGDHRYEGVREDLEQFARVVCPGGYLCGDDYGIKGWWDDGVTRAVDEFAAWVSCAQLAVRGDQFLIKLSDGV